MIQGERVALRTVRRTDLDALYLLINDASLKGEHLSPPLRSETAFRKEFDEKCGFQLEGTLRGFVLHRGHPRDALLYSLLRAEALP